MATLFLQVLIAIYGLAAFILAIFYLRYRRCSPLEFALWGGLAFILPVFGPFFVIAAPPRAKETFPAASQKQRVVVIPLKGFEKPMKQDRFLTGILIGIAVLVIIALAVFLNRKDNLNYVADDTPEGVVQNYVVALHKRDFDKAYGYLADLENKPTPEQFHQSFLNHNVDPANAGLEVGKAEISGDSASVSLGLIYSPSDPFSSGYRNTEYAQLVRQNGSWKIKQMPGNFWAYDWYQSTPAPVK